MKKKLLGLSVQLVVLLTAASALAQSAGSEAPRRSLGARLETYRAPGADVTLPQPPDTLYLRDALSLALLHSPRLATFSWQVRSAEAATLQAGVWPNPEIGVEYENFGGTGALEGTGAAEATLTLSQLVPLGGKRGRRTGAARLESALAGWDYETARVATYVATVRAFINVLNAQEQLALARSIVEVAQEVEAAVSARVSAGGTLGLEKNRARAAVEIGRIEQKLAERALAIARRDLAATWGSGSPGFEVAVGRLDSVGDDVPVLEELIARVDKNPEVARWTSELESRRAHIELIKASRVPDLSVTAGIRHDNGLGDVGFIFSLSAPLPSWDRKKGAIREAEYLARRAEPARRSAANEIRREIANAWEILAGAHDELSALRESVLPEAERAAARSGDAYRAGAIQLTDVLDIQRTFFRLRIRHVNALARYHGAIAELEGLTGGPIAGTFGPGGGREDE